MIQRTHSFILNMPPYYPCFAVCPNFVPESVRSLGYYRYCSPQCEHSNKVYEVESVYVQEEILFGIFFGSQKFIKKVLFHGSKLNSKHVIGTCISKDVGFSYQGCFTTIVVDDMKVVVPHEKGVFFTEVGTYSGQYNFGKMSGYILTVLKNGKEYSGVWDNGLPLDVIRIT